MMSFTRADSFGKIPVDEHSTLDLKVPLVRMQFAGTDDQYIPGANVSVKNANLMSGFVSYKCKSGYVG